MYVLFSRFVVVFSPMQEKKKRKKKKAEEEEKGSRLAIIKVCPILREVIVQELCESRGSRPGLSVLTSLLVSVDVKNYCTVLRHWSQLVPNMSTNIRGH